VSQTAFHQIGAAFEAALKASPAVAGGHVLANPVRPSDRDKAQAVLIRLGASRVVESGVCDSRWETAYTFECAARGVSGQNPITEADALLLAVYARLKAIPEATLNTLGVHDIDAEGADLEPDTEAADTPLAVMSLRLTVRHSTARNTLAPAPLT
jgi:hypothetical protein